MPGDRLELDVLGRVERLSVFPRVVTGGDEPEVALGVPHNPLLRRSVHVDGHGLLPFREHGSLLQTTFLQGIDNAPPRGESEPPSPLAPYPSPLGGVMPFCRTKACLVLSSMKKYSCPSCSRVAAAANFGKRTWATG